MESAAEGDVSIQEMQYSVDSRNYEGYFELRQLVLGNVYFIDVNSFAFFFFFQIERRNIGLNLFLTAFCKNL